MAGRCSICHELFGANGISAIKCGHTFHLKCITTWLNKRQSCPVCQSDVNPATDVITKLFLDPGQDSFIGTPSPQNEDWEIEYRETMELLREKEEELFDLRAKKAEMKQDHKREVTYFRSKILILDTAKQDLKMKNHELTEKLEKLQTNIHATATEIGVPKKATRSSDGFALALTELEDIRMKANDVMKEKFALSGILKLLENKVKMLESENKKRTYEETMPKDAAAVKKRGPKKQATETCVPQEKGKPGRTPYAGKTRKKAKPGHIPYVEETRAAVAVENRGPITPENFISPTPCVGLGPRLNSSSDESLNLSQINQTLAPNIKKRQDKPKKPNLNGTILVFSDDE